MAKSDTKKRWTVMVYLAGDNDLDSAGAVDLGEMKQVGSGDQINIVAQFDRAGAKVQTKRYFLRKGTTLAKDAVATLGETNMGDPNVLQDFLGWGAKNYPAEHYLVVIWNHGAGWDDENIYRSVKRGLKRNVSYKKSSVGETVRGAAGAVPIAHVRAMSKRPFKRALFSTTIQQAVQKRAIAFDDQAEDFLDNIELKRVLTAAKKSFGGKIDVLGMDACLMNMAEVAYQIRNTAQVLVGSQEVEPADGWPYTTVLRELAKTPDMTPAQVGKVIVDRYLASYKPNEGVTQSALDLSASTKLEGAIDKLAATLLKELPTEATEVAVMRARRAAQGLRNPRLYRPRPLLPVAAQVQRERHGTGGLLRRRANRSAEFRPCLRVQGRGRDQLERGLDLLPRGDHLAAVRQARLREEQQVERVPQGVSERSEAVRRKGRDLFICHPSLPGPPLEDHTREGPWSAAHHHPALS